MSPEPAKAARYIQQLDASRCNGEWAAVPELVRKVRKHAPERVCLTLAAEYEYAVMQALRDRPSTSMSWSASGLGQLVGPLTEAIEKEKTFVEDEFHAQVCLGWIHWISAEPALACASLPASIEQEFAQLDGTGKASAAWTRICAVKASYIKGVSLNLTGAPMKALEVFGSALPILSTTSSNSTPEYRIWAEIMLSQFCLLSSEITLKSLTPLVESEALSAFRAWATFWEYQPSHTASAPGGNILYSSIPRRQIWKQYYVEISKIIQNTLLYPIGSITPANTDISARSKLKAELHRVESSYEAILLKEVQFPRADESSEEVEEWVQLVMENWKILSGDTWQNQDRDQSVGEAASRRVLDILYRAATKTFHSTSILRHLFTVHLAVGEFDIAFKAFDTYLEIANKRKAQVEKTGEVDEGLDSDEIVLTTASACITALCRYGSRHAAEKAKDLGHYFEDWLAEHEPQSSFSNTTNGYLDGRSSHSNGASPNPSKIQSHVFAGTWRAIGIAKAQWARVTFDAKSRPQIQTQAIKCLRRALSPDYKSTNNVDALFALALVLAERRELSTAIEVVKRALLPPHPSSFSGPNQLKSCGLPFSRERSLIPLWHLLALLLSARQEFTTAIRACEGAFEQFQDPKYLFGETRIDGAYRSEHLNKVEKPSMRSRGLVDDMDDFEKETILEVKMTQLTLVEILEGSDIAVNASDELLSLYGRLFGEPHKLPLPNIPQTLPPQSSAGTLRSFKGSIFGRSRQSIRKTAGARGNMSSLSGKSTLPVRPHTSQTNTHAERKAPTIEVTDENDGTVKQPPHHERLHKRSMSLPRKKSQSSMRNRSTSASEIRSRNRLATASDVTEADRMRLRGEQSTLQPDHALQGGVRISQVGLAISPDIPSAAPSPSPSPDNIKNSSPNAPSPVSRNMLQTDERPTQDSHPQQDIRVSSPFALPTARFTKDQERRRRIGTLLRVWLLIAGFYRRAEMFEDARGAVEEAYTLVNGLEGDISRDKSGSISIYDGGWGISKSVEELWGDVWSEYGYLSSAKGSSYVALSDFEHALTHFPDHPSAIVGLSNILLDIYTEALLPPSDLPQIGPSSPISTPSQSTVDTSNIPHVTTHTLASGTTVSNSIVPRQSGPLGFPDAATTPQSLVHPNAPPVARTALLDRLAARDRAYGLLSSLTKLGTGWNHSEAWFALARAHEEAGQLDKARDALWWCVELEEGKGIRNWDCIVPGGYVL